MANNNKKITIREAILRWFAVKCQHGKVLLEAADLMYLDQWTELLERTYSAPEEKKLRLACCLYSKTENIRMNPQIGGVTFW